MANKKGNIHEILSDAEKAALTQFADHKTMAEAVKKVLLASVYFNGTLRKDVDADPTLNAAFSLAFRSGQEGIGAISNEQLGEDLRAMAEGVRLIENGFSQIAVYKDERPSDDDDRNPAR